MCAGQSPNTHRTPCAFRLCARLTPEGARDAVFPPDHFLGAHLFLTFFRWLEATQERRGRLVKAAFFAPRSGRSEAQSLDWPPALRTLASGKMGDHPFPWPPSFSRCAFFLSACCRIAQLPLISHRSRRRMMHSRDGKLLEGQLHFFRVILPGPNAPFSGAFCPHSCGSTGRKVAECDFNKYALEPHFYW